MTSFITFDPAAAVKDRQDEEDDPAHCNDRVINGGGAVLHVPFSWEAKPGVPLVDMARKSDLVPASELRNHHRSTAQSLQQLMHSTSTFPLSHHRRYLPLPEPPSRSAVPTLTVPCTTHRPTISSSSSHPAAPAHHKHSFRRSPFHNKKHTQLPAAASKSSCSLPLELDDAAADDPFLKALHACRTQSTCIKGPNNLIADPEKAVKLKHIPAGNAAAMEGRMKGRADHQDDCSKTLCITELSVQMPPISMASLSKLCREKIHGAKSSFSSLKQAADHDKELAGGGKASKPNNSTCKQSSKDFDNKVVLRNMAQLAFNYNNKVHLTGKPQLSIGYGRNGARVLDSSAKAEKHRSPAPNADVLSVSSDQASMEDDGSVESFHRGQLISGKLPVKIKHRISSSGEEKTGSEKQIARYNGHPAFMVPSLHQSPKLLPKIPIARKPAQPAAARPAHHRRSSSAGWLKCTTAEYRDTIIRL